MRRQQAIAHLPIVLTTISGILKGSHNGRSRNRSWGTLHRPQHPRHPCRWFHFRHSLGNRISCTRPRRFDDTLHHRIHHRMLSGHRVCPWHHRRNRLTASKRVGEDPRSYHLSTSPSQYPHRHCYRGIFYLGACPAGNRVVVQSHSPGTIHAILISVPSCNRS